MKRQLTVALGLAVLATPAFATKARLQALGEDSYGSAYINDNRNIWLNSAQVNNHKDLVTYEFGGNVNQDSSETARGEGGVFKTIGNLVYGVQFGGASNTGNALRTGAGLLDAQVDTATAGSTPTVSGTGLEENNLAVFVGGDAGVKWGANLEYAKTAQENDAASSEAMRTRLGVIMGDTQVYANINLINNAKGQMTVTDSNPTPAMGLTGTAKFEGDLGYQVGAIHAWNGNTLFVDYRSFDMSSKIQATGTGALASGIDQKKDISSQQGEIGIGRVERLNDKTSLFMKGSFFMRDIENDHGKGGATAANAILFGQLCGNGAITACKEYKTQRVPVVIGLETEATSWLTLRGSVSQVVWGTNKVNGDESTVRNSTAINAGATLKFGELSVDGVIGTADASSANAGENTGAGNGTLRTDNLMSRVAMTYRF